MIDCRGISNRGVIKTICTLYKIFAVHAKSMTHFAWGAKISHTMRIKFAHCVKIS